MDRIYIDFFAVGLSAALYAIIYFVWYSKWLFGVTWLKHSEIKAAELKKTRWIRLFWNFSLGLIIAYFIAFFEAYLSVTTVSDGMFVGFCFWLGFVVTALLSPAVWARRPMVLFFVESGAKLLSYLVMSGIIGA
jgi:hypothetical protein